MGKFSPYFALLMLILRKCEALEAIEDPLATLRKDLFAEGRYDRYTLPPETIGGNHSVHVELRLLILHVYDLDESTGTLLTNGWFMVGWDDSRLAWSPKDYSLTHMIRVPKNTIWTPDIILYNNAAAMRMDIYGGSENIVFYSGHSIWLSPLTIRSTCPIDHRLYPFDEHLCNMTFGTWSYDSSELNISISRIDSYHEKELLMHFKTENPQWEIVERIQRLDDKRIWNFPNAPTFLLFQLRLRRQAPLFKFLLVIPSILAMMLTLALFWLPSDHSSKFTIGGIAIGIEVALLLVLGLKIPPGGQHIPAIVLLCGNSLIFSVLSVTTSVMVVKITHFTNKDAVPETLTKILKSPARRLFCLKQRDAPILPQFKANERIAEDKGEAQLLDTDLVEIENDDGVIENTTTTTPTTATEWMEVGVAIDRCCFVLYCFAYFLIGISSLS